MFLLSEIKSIYKKSQAAVVVQNLLEQQVRTRIFDLDPAEFSNNMKPFV